MPDLNFAVEAVTVAPYAATPTLSFRLHITNGKPEDVIQSAILRAQIQIEVTRRQYSTEEKARLRDLFGEPERWSQTLKSLLWTHAAITVPAFEKETTAEIAVPCTFDFNVGATKYFHGLEDGFLPLNFQFSGTVFYRAEGDALQVSPVSWDKEAKFKLPVRVWRELMDAYYPNTAWLCLRRDAFERMQEYKVRNGIPTWEEVFERIFANLNEPVER